MAGFSDIEQRLCLGLALWNGNDAILKERMFGLTGAEGNHGEDPKDYWWYLDSMPSHAWNRWRYHYPQTAFPYQELVEENGRRGKHDPEYELLDTGAFDDDRYWVVEVDYVKADVDDIVMVVRATNAGPDAATLHVLPTAWFRNTWSWEIDAVKPTLRVRDDGVVAIDHPIVGPMELVALPGPDGAEPVALFCDNETNDRRVFGSASGTAHPKDGINDHVVNGAPTVNPDHTGTKVSLWYQLEVAAGATAEVRLRLRPAGAPDIDLDAGRSSCRPSRGRRVLRRADPTRSIRRRGDGHAAGLRRNALGQAAVRVRRRPMARRRPGAAAATGITTLGTQRPVDALRGVRHHVDARPVGVPVVRRMGPRLPLRHVRPPRPGVRQVPVAAAVPRMVPAPERRPARLRVGLRRRQPAGAGVGRARGVRHRRRTGHRLPGAGVRQAPRELHLVGQPRGRRRVQPVRRWVPRPRQHRPDRPLPPAGRWPARTVRRHRLDGVLRVTMATIASILNRSASRSADDLVVKFLEHFAAIRRALEASGVWDEDDGFFYDQLIAPNGTVSPSRSARWSASSRCSPPCRSTRSSSIGPGCTARVSLDCSTASVASTGSPNTVSCVARPARRECCSASRTSSGWNAVLATTVRSGRVPLAVRPAGPVGLAPRPSVPTRRRRRQRHDRLRARRVDHVDVRRQLELARPDLDAPQLPRDRCDRALRPLLR